MSNVIAVVGAGGKSSLIEALADKFAAAGQKVCITTTTHIYKHDDRENVCYYGRDEGEKLSYPGDEEFSRLCSIYDAVIVEADGSKHFPIKIPAVHEPVIPENTNHIFVVMGLHALARPIGEVCQRFYSANKDFPGLNGESLVNLEIIDFIAQTYYVDPLRRKFPDIPVYYVRNNFVRGQAAGKRVALILLASGSSRRFEGGRKLFHVFRGKELFRYGLEALISAKSLLTTHGITAKVFITGGNISQCEGAAIIDNPDRLEGISASIRHGTRAAVEHHCDAVLFLAGDQPNFSGEDISRLVQEFLCSGKLCGCAFSDHPANPGIFSAAMYHELQKLSGDSGALRIIKANPAQTHYYVVNAGKLLDVDTLNDTVNL